MRRLWSKEEDDILIRVYPKGEIPGEEICKLFPDRTWCGIQNRAITHLGLHRDVPCRVDKNQLIRLEKVYKI